MAEENVRLATKNVFSTPGVNQELAARGTAPISEPTPLLRLVKRPELDLITCLRLAGRRPRPRPAVLEQMGSGTSTRATSDGRRRRPRKWPRARISVSRKTSTTTRSRGPSLEMRQKLQEVRPRSLGQAARMSGVTPAAVALSWCI